MTINTTDSARTGVFSNRQPASANLAGGRSTNPVQNEYGLADTRSQFSPLQNQTLNESKINEATSYIPPDIHQQVQSPSEGTSRRGQHPDQQKDETLTFNKGVWSGPDSQARPRSQYRGGGNSTGPGRTSRSRSPLANTNRSPAGSSQINPSNSQNHGSPTKSPTKRTGEEVRREM